MDDISPSLIYRDPKAAIEFLERAFGFERGMVVEDGDRIAHAELWHADAHYARAKEAGAEIVMELTDTDYGSRD